MFSRELTEILKDLSKFVCLTKCKESDYQTCKVCPFNKYVNDILIYCKEVL